MFDVYAGKPKFLVSYYIGELQLFIIVCARIRAPRSAGQSVTINVPLFKKMWDIIIFLRDNNFLSRFEGHFEGAKTFLTP
jgi:hypothetical protein